MSTEPAASPAQQCSILKAVIDGWTQEGSLQLLALAINATTAQGLVDIKPSDSIRLQGDQISATTRLLPFVQTESGELMLTENGQWVLRCSTGLGGDWVTPRSMHNFSVVSDEELQSMFVADKEIPVKIFSRLQEYGAQVDEALQRHQERIQRLVADLPELTGNLELPVTA